MIPQSELWATLALEGNDRLIDLLHKAEQGIPGYTTVIVTKAGFSEDDDVHNAVLDWLTGHPQINIFNPGNEIVNLELALHGERK